MTTCVVCTAVTGPVPPAVPVAREGLQLSLRVEACDDHAEFLEAELRGVLEGVRTRLSRSRWSRLREDESPEAVRDWARSQGLPVASSGRLSGPLVTAYRAAQRRERSAG